MLRVRGTYAGQRTDQILPPGMGGFRNAKIYPIQGAELHEGEGPRRRQLQATVNLWTAQLDDGPGARPGLPVQPERRSGSTWTCSCSRASRSTPRPAEGRRLRRRVVGWNQDYPDPYDFLDVLLNGNNIHETNNNNLAYFNNASINKKLARANKLVGAARYKAYGDLDLEITHEVRAVGVLRQPERA